MQNLLNDFEQHLQKKHLSRATVRNYKTDLKLFLNWCGARYGSLSSEEIKPHLFDEYINKLVRENRTASSIKRYKISLYKFFEWTQPHYQAPPRVAFQKVALPAVVPCLAGRQAAPTPGRIRPRLPLKYALPVLLATICLATLGFSSYNNYVQPLRTYFDDLTTELTTERGFSKIVKRGLTLAEEAVRGVLEINVPVEMNQGLTATTVTADTVTAGNLTYTVAAGNAIDITGGQNPVISIADDSLDFTELKDLLTLDNSTEIALGSSNLTFSGSGTISLPAGQIDNAELANSTINLAGDSGSSAIALGGTITVTGGEGIDTSESSGTLAVSIAATAVTAGSYGSSTAVPTFTVDADGRLTAAGMTTLSAGVIAADTLDFSEFKDAMQLDASTTIDLNSGNLSFWNTGNVGIGTTSPGAKLDVSGTLTASGTVTFSGLAAGTDNSVLVLNSSNQLVTDEIDSRVWGATLVDYSGSSANYIAKFSDADTLTNSVLYELSGNVGIGTTSPSYKLDVSGAGRFTSGLTASNIRVGVSGSGEIDTTSGNLTLDSAGGTVTVDDHLKLLDDMELQLGTNPDVRFLWETADADNHYLSTALSGSLNWIVSADNGVDWNRAASSNPTLYLQSADETSPNEYLSLSHDGTDAQIAVGSGGLTTTAASFTLTNGTTNFVAINSSGAVTLQPTAGQDLSITTSGTGDFAVNTNQFFIDASEGKVGIGTTSPDTKLHIVGDAYIASDSGYSFDNPSSSSDLYVEGNLEVKGSLFVDASTTFTGTQVKLNDDVELQLGSSSDARFVWETADADSHYLSTVLTNNMNWIISADNNTDWGRAAASNPTVYIQSADETSVNDYLALYHDQTNALITSGSGNIVLTPAGNVVLTSGKELYSFGSATLGNRTYTQDNYVTDAQTFTGSIEALDLGLAAVAGGAAGLWQDNTTYIYASNVSSGDVVVADNGNMGIGTTIPSYKLDVRGTINITGATTLNGVAYTWPGSDAASSGRALTSDGAGTLGWTDLTGSGSGDVGAWTVSGNDLYPDSTAYHVGIGNTGPAYTLDVTGTGRFTVGGYIDAVQIGISSAGEIDTTSGNLTIDSAGGTVTIDDILAVASTASFSGNVNLTDDVELQFGGSSDVRFLWETADIDNHYLSTVLSGSMNWIVSADNSIDWGRTGSTNPTLFIQSADSDSKSEYLSLSHNGTDAVINVGSGKMHLAVAGGNKLTVDTGGNVGIGTTAPDALLHTVGGDVYVAPDSGYTFNNTSANEDLYVFGNLEVDGTIHGDVSGDISGGLNPGFTQGSVVFMGAAGLAEDNANFFWNDSSNYLGIGTTGPGAKLEVAGQCVTGDSELITEDGQVLRVDQIKGGERVYSLDEGTGKLVPAKVRALLDMGWRQTFELTTEDGRSIVTTGNHPYLTKDGWKEVTYLSENQEIAVVSEGFGDGLGGQEDKTSEEHKSNHQQSISDRCTGKEILGVHSDLPFSDSHKLNNKPNIANGKLFVNSRSYSSNEETPSNPGVTNNTPNQPEAKLTVIEANTSKNVFAEQNFINFNDSTKSASDVKRAKRSPAPSEALVLGWVKITSIKPAGVRHVWDLSIEGTHNFVANGIIAHNTYISGASAALGIGYAPSTFTAGTVAAFNGNVGIGTTGPAGKLHVVGECVAEDSIVLVARECQINDKFQISNRQIKDVQPGDCALSLNEGTQTFGWQKVEKTLDKGVQEVYELITEGGKRIETTGNHPYLARKADKLSSSRPGAFDGPILINNDVQNEQTVDNGEDSHSQKWQIDGLYHISNLLAKYQLAPQKMRVDTELNTTREGPALSRAKSEANREANETSPAQSPTSDSTLYSDLENRNPLSISQDYIRRSSLSSTPLEETSLTEWTKVIYLKPEDEIATLDGWEKVVSIRKTGQRHVYDLQIENTHNFVANSIVAHNTYISGNVGIGTTGPLALLSVGASSQFQVNSSGNISTSGLLTVSGAGNSSIAGNLGIGTTSPTALLHLSVGSTTVVGQKITLASGATANAFEINSTAGASGDKFLVTAGGNVGIGTTSPTAMLDVHGTIENGLVGWWPLDGDATDKSIGGHNGTMTNSACPANYVLVPGNATYGTSDFCVMQYEAKSVGGVATSQADVTPWASINQTGAAAACITAGGHLITNNEWMTIARNAEAVASNWGNGVPNSTVASGGGLKRGNVGQTDSASCDEANPAFGSGRNSKSMLTLSNGQTIWDFSGNVWEWTNDSITCAADSCTAAEMPYDAVPGEEWVEFPLLAGYGSLTYDKIRPIGTSLNSLYGVGQIYTDNTIASPSGRVHAFIRGGYWNGGAYAGAFTLALYIAPAAADAPVGFRCVR